jgi:exonuclease III
MKCREQSVSLLQELQVMASLTSEYEDVWRQQHPNVWDTFTVWNERTNARATNRGLRIDYVLCNAPMKMFSPTCEILQDLPPVRSRCSAPCCTAFPFRVA